MISGVFCNFFPHRRDISKITKIKLQIPVTDDNKYPFIANFSKIWWGYREPIYDNDELYGYDTSQIENTINSDYTDSERTIFVAGLPKVSNPDEIAELEDILAKDIFADYG